MDWHCAYGGGAYAFFLWIILHWFIILCRSAMCFQLHCIVISRFHCGTIHERYTSSDIPARTARWTPQPWASKQPSFSCLFVCSLVKTVYIKIQHELVKPRFKQRHQASVKRHSFTLLTIFFGEKADWWRIRGVVPRLVSTNQIFRQLFSLVPKNVE